MIPRIAPVFAGEAGLLGACSHFSDTLLAAKGIVFHNKRAAFVYSGTQRGLRIEYSEQPTPGVTWPPIMGGHRAVGYSVSAILAEAKFKSVTGIQQEGSNAMVQADVMYVSTPLNGLLVSAANDVIIQNDVNNAGCTASEILCAIYSGSGSPPTTRTFRFARFDDGWRVQ